MQLRLFERRSSYSFFAIVNQTPELFFAPPGIADKKNKLIRKRASKLSVAEVLETKYKKKAELQEKELEIRKQELDLQREKFQAETEERRSRFELEMEERRMMLELLKEKFTTN